MTHTDTLTEKYTLTIVKKKFHDSWGKCLRSGFHTPVEGKRDRWGVLKDVSLGGTGTGSSDNVGHIPVWGEVRSLFPYGGKRT